MSAFCVFGVTMEDCIALAREKTRVPDKELKRDLTVEEHAAKADKLARELFASCHGAKQISPAFDTPQFAQDRIDVAKKTIETHSIRIMCRGVKIDPKGKPVLRKGKEVVGWIPYKPTARK